MSTDHTPALDEEGNVALDADTVFAALVQGGKDARSGADIPIHMQDQYDYACAAIEQVLPTMELGSSVTVDVLTAADEWRMNQLETTGRLVSITSAKRMIQQGWSRHANDDLFRLGRITWTTEADRKVLDPHLCFAVLPIGGRYFIEGQREVIIYAYWPQTTYTSRYGDEAASYKDVAGFSHIVGFLPHEDGAQEVIDELLGALKTLRNMAKASQYREAHAPADEQALEARYRLGPKLSIV